MRTGRELRLAAAQLDDGFPERLPPAIWEAPIERGAALEWAVLAALSAAATTEGWTTSWAQLPPERFQRRNDLPLAHGASPGHSAFADLPERFLDAFQPKVVLRREARAVS